MSAVKGEEICPVWTFFGQRGFFKFGRPHFLEQETSDFSKFTVCPHRQGGGGGGGGCWGGIFEQRGGGGFFLFFCILGLPPPPEGGGGGSWVSADILQTRGRGSIFVILCGRLFWTLYYCMFLSKCFVNLSILSCPSREIFDKNTSIFCYTSLNHASCTTI